MTLDAWVLSGVSDEFEQALGDGERQGSLLCSSPWGRNELYMTGQLNDSSLPLFYDM